ncbi:polyribonucleotide nucleotidyltransferase [Candidatus Saccharibacteria bacterium]|nr:polyribonucleotide nucleotidyltransferase [Candidatus Saccharibacteria bacterium]
MVTVKGQFGGRELTLEYGRYGFLSNMVKAQIGDTVVMGIATVNKKPAEGLDFFPLTVEYEERFYASGRISGSRFIKRETRPGDDAILAGRLIDRPIRPLFPKGYRNETQAVALVLSLDPEIRSDIVAMIAVSAALMISGSPFSGPVAGVRMGMDADGKLVVNPTVTELNDSKLDLVVAGTKDAIMMVEAGAKQVSEEVMLKAIETAHSEMQPAIKLQEELVAKVGVKPFEFELALPNEEVQANVDKLLKDKLGTKNRGNKIERDAYTDELKALVEETFAAKMSEEEWEEIRGEYMEATQKAIDYDIRRMILEEDIRPDGRKLEEIRALSSEVGVLPRTHGSSIFTRGTTQALNITTLAPMSYAQLIDDMSGEREKRFMHHYNMPGYTTGEVKRLGGTGRRETGHSALAERAILAVIPDEVTFPYAIRCVTEIMTSNGSTSMAATCSTCLSLMDAGVPILAPVSGIAMGLVTDGKGGYKILSDIQGAEDFAGDMDFKVAGTAEGITALQMDIKVKGITVEIMGKALTQAKVGRATILGSMLKTLPKYREELSEYAPRVESIEIDPEKIGMVIGKGGETIQNIVKETGAEIDIKDDGKIFLASPSKDSIEAAKKWISEIVAEPEVGKVYENAKVVSVLDFGAFVEFMPGHEGLVHVSEMAEERVEKPSDLVKVGDIVKVKLVAVDDKGRNNLSMKKA